MHAPNVMDVTNYKSCRRDLVKLVYHIIDAMSPLRLSRCNAIIKAPRLPSMTTRSSNKSEGHTFKWQGRMLICTKCFVRTHTPLLLPQRRQVCNGKSYVSSLWHDPKGHRLMTATVSGGGAITYCSRCWCYATTFPKRLGEQCRGAPVKSRHSRHFLVNRRHPVSRRCFGPPVPLHA